eukprot:2901247-Pyramimonas_sp.AAC.1
MWGISTRLRARHAEPVARDFGGAPYGTTNRVRGVSSPLWVWHADPALGAFSGALSRATKRVRGVLSRVRVRFGGAPYEATK